MKRWVLWVAVACGAAFAVWTGWRGWHRKADGTLPSGGGGTAGGGVPLVAQDESGRAEGNVEGRAEALPESGDAGMEAKTGMSGRAGRGGGSGGGLGSDEGEFGAVGDYEEVSAGESPNREVAGRDGGSGNPGAFGPLRSLVAGGVAGDKGGVSGETEGSGKPFAVSPEEAERIFAANDAAAEAARELRQQEANEEKEGDAEEGGGPPLWVARSLDWDDEIQEMVVSFRFGAVAGATGGNGETAGEVENGILVQRIPPGWEVQSSSPEADAFVAGSRKLKWLLSGGAVAGREIRLLATPTEGADPGDWDLAPTWFTCRWNGRACMVQPEDAAE